MTQTAIEPTVIEQAAIEPEAVENPLREARLNDSRDFRQEWDVAALNAWVSKSLLQDIDKISGRRDPDPGQIIPVLLSPGGYGKTHLFGRLAFELKDRAFFVFVGAIPDPSRPLEHIRWNVVEALFRSQPGKPSMLARALATLFRASMVEYLRQFPPSEAARHQDLIRELHEGNDAAMKIADSVRNMRSFQRLADSTAQALPDVHASVIKALVLGWSPQQHLARRWLRGECLSEDEAKLVGLDEQAPAPLHVMQGIAAIFQYRVPMVICCDQLDGILKYPEGPVHLANQLMQILAEVPCQFTALSCLENEWKAHVLNSGLDAFKQRTNVFNLDFLTEDQAIAMLSKRLAGWPGRKAELGSLWPFDRESAEDYVREAQPPPRIFIKKCAAAFDRWVNGEIEAPIALFNRATGANNGGEPPQPAPLSFQKEWDKELEAIRKNPHRRPEHIEEARLYKALKEMVILAKLAGESLGEVCVESCEFEVLNSTPTNPKYGLRAELKNDRGKVSVVAAASKVNGGARVVPFLRDLFSVGEKAAGIVLVHPRSDFTMGPAARRLIDDATASGKLVIYALEDHVRTFEYMECTLSLLEQAHSNDLVLETTPITYEQCQKLILETRVIHNLDLLTALSRWNAPPEPVAAPAVSQPALPRRLPPPIKPEADNNGAKQTPSKPKIPIGRVTPPPVKAPIDTAPVAAEPALRAAPSTPACEPTREPTDDIAWAKEKLAIAAAKLTGWGQQVEPESYAIGSSFVRLNVRPVGSKTSFKRVCDRAADLKAHLGLEIEPIIESHSFVFTIDIQRPHRQTVTLEQALAQSPAGKEHDPLFPLGLDEAGKAHWANLGDTTDCHLLVAGATGSGKSEFLKSILASLAHRLTPEKIQFILIDPKRVTFNFAGASPYLRNPIAYDTGAAIGLMKECEDEISRRYTQLQKLQKTDMGQFECSQASVNPRIVLIMDEFANLVQDKESNKALTGLLRKLGSIPRAAGIHLILATQHSDSTVVSMLVRSNLPGKIALQVDSEQNSKLILDSPAAAYLLGKGDLLCKRGGSLIRAQGPLVSQAELERAMKIK